MTFLLSLVAYLICRVDGHIPGSWPIHGKYECRRCMRMVRCWE